MDWYEVNSLLKYRYYAVKEQWEQTRLITYMTAQVNSNKHLKVTDIITFPWEKEEEENTRITDDDVKRLKAMAENYLYNEKKEKKETLPETFDEFKNFVKSEAKYQFWARCEYEIILIDWPCQKNHEKWDVYKQIMMNLHIVTKVFMENINE